MNIAVILSSGTGSRIKSSKIPKQFIDINNKPIIGHTIDRFITNKQIDKVIIACHPEWIIFLNNYLKNNLTNINDIYVVKGGATRNDSIANAISFLKNEIKCKDSDNILIHDAVRIFVTDRIILENIEKMKDYDAVDTIVPSIDTIVQIDDKQAILKNVPDRKYLCNGQTPQTFKFKLLADLYLKQKAEDTSDSFKLLLNFYPNAKIGIVWGDYENFKITSDWDLDYAKKILK